MSWSLTIPVTARDDFAAAVDAADTSPPAPLAEEPTQQVRIAKNTLKLLAEETLGDENEHIAGYAGGHACTDGDTGYDSISVSVHGAAAPVEVQEPEQSTPAT